ncbi:MAG: hypothetical protein IJT34_07785 [Butyrivibrio sp.]|nr:hypothetical protein [Butyrivibrio sp.]
MTCEQRTMEATDAHTLIQNRAEEWGADATTSEAPFPGAEDVTGYWAQLPRQQTAQASI